MFSVPPEKSTHCLGWKLKRYILDGKSAMLFIAIAVGLARRNNSTSKSTSTK
jgi:hypothetical protein